MRHAGVQIDTPPDFEIEQAMISFRGPAPTPIEARALQRQTVIRPSLIVNRRDVGPDATLGILAGEVTAELVSTIDGLSALATEAFSYADGEPGVIVSFDFAAPGVGTARQYHAVRLDGRILTTVTLTIDKLTLTEPIKAKWLALLSSVVRAGDGGIS